MSIWKKITSIDPRWLYIIHALVLFFPIIYPLGIPLTVSPQTQSVYNYINNLQPGDIVLFSNDMGPASWFQGSGPGGLAILRHLLQKPGVRIFSLSTMPEAVLLMNRFWEQLEADGLLAGKEYGVDWVRGGYLAGGEIGINGMAQDFWKAFPVDNFGNQISSLEMMNDLKTGEDVKVVFTVECGSTGNVPGIAGYIRVFHGAYGTDLIPSSIGICESELLAYTSSEQVTAYLMDIRGSAEYENMISMLGFGAGQTDALSVAFVYLILLVIFGNIAFLLYRQEES
jgi:hypothetical protein